MGERNFQKTRKDGKNVNSLGRSVSAELTYSAEVMAGKVVLMQPRLQTRRGGRTLPQLPPGSASPACHCS